MQYHKITDILGCLSTKLKGNENTVSQRCAQTSAGAGVKLHFGGPMQYNQIGTILLAIKGAKAQWPHREHCGAECT